jgi:raffinose/stachyose/melibiose transport system substrate-binding protein
MASNNRMRYGRDYGNPSHKKEIRMKRLFYFWPVFLLFVSLACNSVSMPGLTSSDPATPSTGSPSATPQPALLATETATPGEVTVTWWQISTTAATATLFHNLADEYTAAHPGFTADITILDAATFSSDLNAAMQSGSPPDIFHSYGDVGIQEYAQAGLLKDITADLDQEGWRETFYSAALDQYAVRGKNYGVPRDISIVGLWYNKDLFRRAAIAEPPATWGAFLEDVKKLKAAGITPIALGEADSWTGAFWWEFLALRLGGKAAFEAAFNREGAFTDPPFVEAGQNLQTLINLYPFQDGFLDAYYGDQAAAVGNGNAAMELMGNWGSRLERENSTSKSGIGDSLGWFPFPALEGGTGDPSDALGGIDGWLVGRNAPPEAVEFLQFVSSVESETAQAEQGIAFPVVKGAEVGLTDPVLRLVWQNAAAVKYLQVYYDQYFPPAIGRIVNDSIRDLFAGILTPQQAAQAIEDSVNLD